MTKGLTNSLVGTSKSWNGITEISGSYDMLIDTEMMTHNNTILYLVGGKEWWSSNEPAFSSGVAYTFQFPLFKVTLNGYDLTIYDNSGTQLSSNTLADRTQYRILYNSDFEDMGMSHGNTFIQIQSSTNRYSSVNILTQHFIQEYEASTHVKITAKGYGVNIDKPILDFCPEIEYLYASSQARSQGSVMIYDSLDWDLINGEVITHHDDSMI